MRAQPPLVWVSKIYHGFPGVFRPQRLLIPSSEKKLARPPPGQISEYALSEIYGKPKNALSEIYGKAEYGKMTKSGCLTPI